MKWFATLLVFLLVLFSNANGRSTVFERCKDERLRKILQIAGETQLVTTDIRCSINTEKAYRSKHGIWRRSDSCRYLRIIRICVQPSHLSVQMEVSNSTEVVTGIAILALSNGAPVGNFIASRAGEASRVPSLDCSPGQCVDPGVRELECYVSVYYLFILIHLTRLVSFNFGGLCIATVNIYQGQI